MSTALKRALLPALVLILPLLLAGCPAPKADKVLLPSMEENAAQIRKPGRFVWFDLHSTDMTTVSNFYDDLFGWDFQRTDFQVAGVKNIIHRGKIIGNLFGREAEPGDSWWLCSLSVRNVNASVGVFMEAGGRIEQPLTDKPYRGREIVGTDPQGARLAVLTSYTGDPSSQTMPGRWVGCELWTTDVDGALGFYRPLAGYDAVHRDTADPSGHVLVTVSGEPSGGIVKISGQPLKPQWIPYVGVKSVLRAVTKAQSMGGEVVVPPDPAVLQGRVAILRDPSGAVFGVQQIR